MRARSAKSRGEATEARRPGLLYDPKTGGVETGPQPDLAVFVAQQDRDGEAARPPGTGAIRQFRASQPASRREQRQGLQHIGLAGAVLAGQRDHGGVDIEVERGVGAIFGQHDPAHMRAALMRS